MTKLGDAAKYIRNRLGLSQRAAAEELGISHVHLNKIENDKTSPTHAVLQRYVKVWGVDLYVLAVSKFSENDTFPKHLQPAVDKLIEHWEKCIECEIKKRRM